MPTYPVKNIKTGESLGVPLSYVGGKKFNIFELRKQKQEWRNKNTKKIENITTMKDGTKLDNSRYIIETTSKTKPLHKILKVNEKTLNERLSKKEKSLEVKEVEPKTVTFDKDESVYFNINKSAFKNTEARMKNDGADIVVPILTSLPKYKSYLKNLKKSLTDIFGKTFYVYRLMDRSEFQQLAYSTKGIDKPLSVSLDKTITDKGSWVIGKIK